MQCYRCWVEWWLVEHGRVYAVTHLARICAVLGTWQFRMAGAVESVADLDVEDGFLLFWPSKRRERRPCCGCVDRGPIDFHGILLLMSICCDFFFNPVCVERSMWATLKPL